VGLVGESFCGFLTAFFEILRDPDLSNSATPLVNIIEGSAVLGGLFGGPFGLIAFPLCFFLFLKKLPLAISLAVTIPATVIAGWLGTIPVAENPIQNATNALGEAGIYVAMYGPGFLGLLLSSIALRILEPRLRHG
jgi:hypothetical protein